VPYLIATESTEEHGKIRALMKNIFVFRGYNILKSGYITLDHG